MNVCSVKSHNGCQLETPKMSFQDRIQTWDLLRSLGFEDDSEALSEGGPGLSFDFGNLKLSARRVMGKSFSEVLLLTGVLETRRRIAKICDEMLPTIESREQGIALLAFFVDKATRMGLDPQIVPNWLADGRKYRTLLPWEKERAEYAARPHCLVHRDWTRLALKTLTPHLNAAQDDAVVSFSFDGATLTMRCGTTTVPLPAEGKPWSQSYAVRAGSLRHLPKRFMGARFDVGVWKSRLTLEKWSYPIADA